jgi:hypothetical protein
MYTVKKKTISFQQTSLRCYSERNMTVVLKVTADNSSTKKKQLNFYRVLKSEHFEWRTYHVIGLNCKYNEIILKRVIQYL